jgi:succinate-semialdehyde dehydrogenase / glutarate-semialdehyde dehydrogenase
VTGDTERERESELLARTPTSALIGGLWRLASDGMTFPVHDPSTGRILAHVADVSPEGGVAALDAAVDASASWAAVPPRGRSEILRRAWNLLQERADDFALLMTLEMGKPLAEAHGEITYGGEFLRWFAEEAVRIPGRFGQNPEGTGTAIVSHRPVGPSFLITPWNFPLAMATRKIAPALAAGCTVVVKPAELTPLTTLLLGQLLIDAGVPAGVVNIIPTSRAKEVSAPIIADPRLRKLSFTGSTAVGQKLLAQAAPGILRTSMELGGNAPFLVFEDADLDAAVDGAMKAKFRNMGQACTAANRFLVHETVADEFTRRLAERVKDLNVGRGTDATTTIGPLINPAAVENCRELVADAVASGGRVVVGGNALTGAGNFYEPTIVTGLASSARMLHEEIFAPLIGIITFRDEAEAIMLANSTEYGLVSYAYTRDFGRAQRLIDTIETGMMGINTGIVSNAASPFGGVKKSGLGREGGAEGLLEYMSTKYTLVADACALQI